MSFRSAAAPSTCTPQDANPCEAPLTICIQISVKKIEKREFSSTEDPGEETIFKLDDPGCLPEISLYNGR
jgi:hypothetical protein